MQFVSVNFHVYHVNIQTKQKKNMVFVVNKLGFKIWKLTFEKRKVGYLISSSSSKIFDSFVLVVAFEPRCMFMGNV